MTVDYWNRWTQAEKKQEVLRDTFLSRAEADAQLEAQGRFKRQNETRITGAAAPSYPQQPSGPWSSQPVPLPDPITDQLGYGIDEQEAILPTSSADQSPGGDVGQGGSRPSSPFGSASSQPSRKSFRRF
jgi:hypothetical protein